MQAIRTVPLSMTTLTLAASIAFTGPPAATAQAITSPSPTSPPVPVEAVVVGELSVAIPPPGITTSLYVDFVDGTSEKLVVQTLEDGTVLVNPPTFDGVTEAGAEPSEIATPSGIIAGTGECNDATKVTGGKKWATRMAWYFYSASMPRYLTLSEVVADLREGVTNITHTNNNCDLPDTITATASYQGVTTASANITSSGTCGPFDGLSVTDFGTLPSTWVGVACNKDTSVERIESDIRLNKANFAWTTGACGSGYYVEGISTHERGHTWNAGDLPSGHPNLTMGGANGGCPLPDEKQTIGYGDILAFDVNY